jgi:hypothetical protein
METPFTPQLQARDVSLIREPGGHLRRPFACSPRKWSTRLRTMFAWAALCLVFKTARADENVWLPVRDQNPFVLGSGLPLLPQVAPAAGQWDATVTLTESNTQLWSTRSKAPQTQVMFGAETRESRVTLNYAINDAWSARASIGDEWIGVGFLDRPIQHFHKWIGAPHGYRDGRLGGRPPVIRVTEDGQVLYELDKSGQALAPLLLDVTREWRVSETTSYGISIGAKLPVGDTRRLSDVGDTGVSLSAFGEFVVFDDIKVGVRAGYLHSNGNDALPGLARSSVEFGDVSARGPLLGQWNWVLQYDVHTALYQRVPQFLGYAGVYTIGVARPLGEHSEFVFGVSEDLPLGHTQDVSFMMALRYRP